MISVREGIGYRVMGDYMAYWHEVYTNQTSKEATMVLERLLKKFRLALRPRHRTPLHHPLPDKFGRVVRS